MRTPNFFILTGAFLALVALPSALTAQSAMAIGTAIDDDVQPRTLRNRGAITAPVTTPFGVYHPYSIPKYAIVAGANEEAIADGFANVAVHGGAFPWNNYFSEGERSLLRRNSFVVRPEAYASFGAVYAPETSPRAFGTFVTVDAVMHGLRITLDEALSDFQNGYAPAVLAEQLAGMSKEISAQLSGKHDRRIEASLIHLLAYIETGRMILDPAVRVDPRVVAEVDREIALVEAAAGPATSVVLPDVTIDYGAFRDTTAGSADGRSLGFDRARLWVGSVAFMLRNSSGQVDPEATRRAALMARTIAGLASSPSFSASYRRLGEPLRFFYGSDPQAASWELISTALRQYYGRLATVDASFLLDDQQLVGFVNHLAKQEGLPSGRPVVFRLYNIGNTVGDMPQVLAEVMRGDGSRVMKMLSAAGGVRAALYIGASSETGVRAVGGTLTERPAESWVQSMDMAVLYTMQALASDPQTTEGLPRFMQNEAWRDREILSAAGGLNDFTTAVATLPLRSVAKAGSYGRGNSVGDPATDGYVEPNPEAWGRLAALVGYLRSGLAERDGEEIIDPRIVSKLKDIENASAMLMQIAASELANRNFTSEQTSLIASMRDRIIAYETPATGSGRANAFMVTASASPGRFGGVNGHPLVVYAIVPRNDGGEGTMLTRGAVYSYYEIDARDVRGASGAPITISYRSMPWMASFVSADRPFDQDVRKLSGIAAPLPAAVAYTPAKGERRPTAIGVALTLESPVVSRIPGELWYRLNVQGRHGDFVVVVVNTAGQTIKRSDIGRPRKADYLDLVRVREIPNGDYYLRVQDVMGHVLASAPFSIMQ